MGLGVFAMEVARIRYGESPQVAFNICTESLLYLYQTDRLHCITTRLICDLGKSRRPPSRPLWMFFLCS